MIDMSTRRKRLERLVELAQVYRNWSRRELSETLGRDASKLVPASGNPKLDLIVELADVLDWTVGDVTDCLWNTGASDVTPIPDDGTVTFEEIDRQAGEAHRAGRYRQLIRLAARARELAENVRRTSHRLQPRVRWMGWTWAVQSKLGGRPRRLA